MPINLVITNAGRAALVNAANTGTLPVTITQIGVASLYTPPSQTLTALPSELKRLNAIAGQVVADDTLHVSMKDESADAYSLRTIGLYLASGTLFACAGQSEAILNKASSAVALAAFDIAFDDLDAASLSFGSTDFMMPSATTEAQGVVELATVAEAQNGSDPARVLTPFTARAAVLSWLLGLDGAASGLDADLLDGQHGAWYADIPARLGYTPVNMANYTATVLQSMLLDRDMTFGIVDAKTPNIATTGGVRIRANQTSGFAYSQITNHTATAQWGYWRYNVGGDADWYGAGGLRRGGNTVWDAGNDGAGSGLDADLLDGKHASELVPAGVIWMWAGSIASIPAGWALCNGGNGTPDLRDRFIVGAGGGSNPGAAGGAASHSHGINIYNHVLSIEQIPSHNHAMFANVAVDTALTGATTVARATTSSPGESEYQMRSAAGTAATVGITGNAGANEGHTHAAGSSDASSLPPYYALAFIMKL